MILIQGYISTKTGNNKKHLELYLSICIHTKDHYLFDEKDASQRNRGQGQISAINHYTFK